MAGIGDNHLVSNMKWPVSSVDYDISAGCSSTKTDIIDSAASVWSDVNNSSFALYYNDNSLNDWYYSGIDTLGTTVTEADSDGDISEVNTYIDSTGKNWNFSGTPTSSETDFYSVVAQSS